MLQEKGLAMLRGVFDADPIGRLGLAEPLGHERLQDPIMHTLHIGRNTISIGGATRIKDGANLLRLSQEAQLGQGLLNLLGQLIALPLVHILPNGRSLKLECHM